MANLDLVRLERRGKIAILTLDRPPVNALSMELYSSLVARLDAVGSDPDLNVILLTGAGRRAFCAGADVKELSQLDSTTRRERHQFVSDVWSKVANVEIPTICAIQAPAPGGGAVLASLCDYRVASQDAFFSYPEVDRGTVAGGGVFLRKLGVPAGAIREILYTGRRYTAEEALALHLVDRVVPPDSVLEEAMGLAEAIAAKARLALVLMKRAIIESERETDWERGYRATHELSARLTGTPEAKEGMAAFLEGRGPTYGG